MGSFFLSSGIAATLVPGSDNDGGLMDEETTPLGSAQPEDPEWDYEDEPHSGRVLWGRMAALVIALGLAFLIGRLTSDRGGVSASEYARVKRQLAAARAQSANQAPAPAPAPTESSPASSPSPQPSPTTGATRTYVVKPGDTLRGIAVKFYGDVSLVTLIAEANHISDPTIVQTGTKLIIPPKP
jgi:LysM repeat protein